MDSFKTAASCEHPGAWQFIFLNLKINLLKI